MREREREKGQIQFGIGMLCMYIQMYIPYT